jgi:hypothetical protein
VLRSVILPVTTRGPLRSPGPAPQGEADGEHGEGSSPAAADAEKWWHTELMVPVAIIAAEVRRHSFTVGVTAPPPALFWGDTFYDATGDLQQDLVRARVKDPTARRHRLAAS